MVFEKDERFNGRIAEFLATHRFDSAQGLETTLPRYVWLYNHHLPQRALRHSTPMEAMKKWYAENYSSQDHAIVWDLTSSATLCIEAQYAKLLTRFACHLGDSFRITQADVNNW